MARYIRYTTAAMLVGIIAAAFAIGFRLALHQGLALVVGNSDVLAGFRGLATWARVVIPAAGGLCAGLIATIAARSGGSGHGVADVLEAVALGRGEIKLGSVLTKSLASLAAIIRGGSVGREGSIIQFGAGSGALVGNRLGLDAATRRTLVAAGTAAGFAAAYNTPIAGVVFVLEIVTGVINLEIVLPTVIATVTATTLTRLVIGGGPIYGQRAFTLVTNWELGLHALLGVLAALAGVAFMLLLAGGERLAAKLPRPRWLRAAVGGLIVGVIAIGFPQVTGNGYEAIHEILDVRVATGLLAGLVVLKMVATVSSVSSGSPGGVFTPTLFLGAALGGLFGAGVAQVVPHAVAGDYALVGMAAMIAATTQAPLKAAMLVFELSGDYSIVAPLLLATSVAAALARRLHPESIYTEELARRGVPWRGNLTERLARSVRAQDILRRDEPWLPDDALLEDALGRLERGEARVVYIGREPLRGDRRVRRARRAPTRGPSAPAKAIEIARPIPVLAPSRRPSSSSPRRLWRLPRR